MRGLESLEATRLTEAEARTQHWNEVTLSSGGQGTGKVWTHIPCGLSEFMDADHFITALRLRMADLEFDGAALCQMPKGKEEGARCEVTMDRKG